MTTADAEPQSTAPYATGGGGTVLEHRYGALLLGHLLTGDPISELGSDAAPVSVRFQASAFSPVDDLDVRGRTADGSERRVSIGVRRAPKLTGSDLASARLLASYLRVVHDDWDEVRAGRWRLGLAVISPNPAVQQVGELAVIAHGADDEAAFRAEVSRARRTTKPVRNRLVHVDALVQAAAGEAGIDLNRVSAGELTWRLLHGLRLRELRLEGADETDRSTAVGQLRRVVPDAAVVAADNLFVRLADLSGRYAPGGAHVTESLLRGDLSGTALDRSPSYAPAWRLLDGLADRLRDRIRFGLSDSSTSIELDRKEQRHAIAAAMATAAAGPGVLVVVGEPDVGKSALTLRAAETLAADGAAVTTLSLRDLPETALDFEALLGGRLTDVLSGTALAKLRLLVLDGAEVAMEGRGPLLTELTTAALRAGLGVVAITRTDGGKIVWRALRDAAATASGTTQVQQHEVLQLSPTEAATVSATFATLARLADQPRATWLLERPGLVDLLLRGDVVAALPGGALSEADVFASVWEHLVRRGNVSPPTGPTPDQRERALTSLARRLLLPVGPAEAPDAAALPSLRSDGLLLPPAQTSAWSPGEQFASDLIRDLSLTRLLIVDGFDLITQGGAPRWALRAVRLACQATLLAAPNPEETWTRLQSIFDDVAAQHGQRWAELPLEAMLTLGAAAEMLTVVWPTLLVERRAGLRTLLRLALQRYTRQGFGDAAVLGSLVALAYCGADDVGQGDRYDDGTGKQTRELVLAWLRGLVVANVDLLPLRQQVRDRILATDPVPYDEFAVEALAMLGPDLDDRATAFLKGLADVGGGHLAEAVESIGPILAMSQHQPELLIELAEAYYVRRRDADGEHGWSMDELDDGIRSHRKTGGFGPPWAAWYYGPFFRLLNIRPQGAMAFINRMLDRAASTRVEGNQRWGATTQPAEADLPGLDLDLPGVGVRRCVGDAHVWSWYRGSSVGPYPCMSALLAVERFADQLVDTLGVPLANVAAFLLRDCHNLAMPGLVAGLIVRHLDRAGEMLDSWLARPELWHLEFSRTSTEGHFHVQGTDPPELVGRDRRRHSFRDIAAEMTLRATAAGDQQRLDTLTAIGDDLLRHARELVAGSGDDEDEIATVDGWAAAFHPENYHLRRTDGDGAVVEYEHPEDVQAALAASLAQLSRVNEALRLQMTYGRPDDRVAPVDTLIADIALARQLAEDPPVQGPLHPADPVAAVACCATFGVRMMA